MYKTSNSLAYIGKQSNKLFSHSVEPRRETSVRQSLDGRSLVQPDSSLAQVAQKDDSEQQSQEDRMNLWIKNVNSQSPQSLRFSCLCLITLCRGR